MKAGHLLTPRQMNCINSFEGDVIFLCELWREALTGHKVNHPSPRARAETSARLPDISSGTFSCQPELSPVKARGVHPSLTESLPPPCPWWGGFVLSFFLGGNTGFLLLLSLRQALIRWPGQMEAGACLLWVKIVF